MLMMCFEPITTTPSSDVVFKDMTLLANTNDEQYMFRPRIYLFKT